MDSAQLSLDLQSGVAMREKLRANNQDHRFRRMPNGHTEVGQKSRPHRGRIRRESEPLVPVSLKHISHSTMTKPAVAVIDQNGQMGRFWPVLALHGIGSFSVFKVKPHNIIVIIQPSASNKLQKPRCQVITFLRFFDIMESQTRTVLPNDESQTIQPIAAQKLRT